MNLSIFSLPSFLGNLVITGSGELSSSPKAYLLTDRGRIITWKFYLNKLSSSDDQLLSVQEFFDQFRTWTIILCHGGRFAAGIFERNESLAHKTMSRYVVRKKQGMKQSKKNSRGKRSLSPGAKFRSEQERKFSLEVEEWLKKHHYLIARCDVIAFHAPGKNRNLILSNIEVNERSRKIILTLPFSTHSVTYNEILKSHRLLTRIEFIE